MAVGAAVHGDGRREEEVSVDCRSLLLAHTLCMHAGCSSLRCGGTSCTSSPAPTCSDDGACRLLQFVKRWDRLCVIPRPCHGKDMIITGGPPCQAGGLGRRNWEGGGWGRKGWAGWRLGKRAGTEGAERGSGRGVF